MHGNRSDFLDRSSFSQDEIRQCRLSRRVFTVKGEYCIIDASDIRTTVWHVMRTWRAIGQLRSSLPRVSGHVTTGLVARVSPSSQRLALKLLMPSPRSRITRGNFPALKATTMTSATTSQCIGLNVPKFSLLLVETFNPKHPAAADPRRHSAWYRLALRRPAGPLPFHQEEAGRSGTCLPSALAGLHYFCLWLTKYKR
jgi:hypothetical protein